VAVHANCSGGHSRERASLYGDVTIAAINAQTADMVLVAEGNRLFEHDVLTGDVRRAYHASPCPCNNRDNEDAAENSHPRNDIHASAKDLGHRVKRKQAGFPGGQDQLGNWPAFTFPTGSIDARQGGRAGAPKWSSDPLPVASIRSLEKGKNAAVTFKTLPP
jgi:hypothetical protein